MPTVPDWVNLALIIGVAVALAALTIAVAWGASEIRKILAILTKHERARSTLTLEAFTPQDGKYIARFNRNFHRIRLVCQGIEIYEHAWINFVGDLRDQDPEHVRICVECGMKFDEFESRHDFVGCLPPKEHGQRRED